MKYIVREGIYTKVRKPSLRLRYVRFIEKVKGMDWMLGSLSVMLFIEGVLMTNIATMGHGIY